MIQSDSASEPTPWLALLTFTEDELTLQADQVTSINQALGIPLAMFTPIPRTSTLAYNFTIKDLVALSKTILQPVPFNVENAVDPSPVQAIVLQPSLFAGLFAHYPLGQAKPDSTKQSPDMARYRFMSHVRTSNKTGLTNHVGDNDLKRSAIVCPRTGPSDIKGPVTAYAHLVSLAGVSSSMQLSADKPAALISLYSWSFTYLPPSSYAVERVFQNLGRNVQPFRSPDAVLSASTSNQKSDSWVKDRLAAGYSLVKYRTPTGEVSIAIQRSILSPIKPEPTDFPPSDYGSDLAVIDEKTGLLDLTFQIAWELGRVSAMADRTISASLARLRQVIHSKALETAKDSLDGTFITALAVMPGLINLTSTLHSRIQTFDDKFLPQRWDATSRGTPTRETLAFQTPAVQAAYRSVLASGPPSHIVSAVSGHQAVPGASAEAEGSGDIYNETNAAKSTDWANLLAWIQDRWFLGNIPMHYLIPDPAFIPKESIRTFYVDPSWFKAFVDGALAIADRFDEADEVRETIKKALEKHLNTKLPNGFNPQIPKWGFLIRSEVISKFPDLRIVAPRQEVTDVRPEVLRMEVLDTDLLLALFDREPGEFPGGIMIQPPQHQLSSRFGSALGVQGKELEIEWKKVFRDFSKGQDPSDYSTALGSIKIDITDPANGIYDNESRALCPLAIAERAHTAQSWPGNVQGNVSDATSALVGSQLICSVPELRIADVPSSTIQIRRSLINTLSSSQRRPNAGSSEHPGIVKMFSPSKSPAAPVYWPKYRMPFNPIIGAIAKTDLDFTNLPVETSLDTAVRKALFQPPFNPPPTWPTIHAPTINEPQALVCTSVYNLSCPDSASASPNYYRAVAAPYPLSLGFKTDLHIENICQSSPKDSGYRNLLSLQIYLPVGTNSNPLLRPFPSTTSLPKARAVGIGRRWITRTALATLDVSPPGLNDVVGSTYIVTVLPNTGNVDAPDDKNKGAWDITKQARDMSVVLENVQLNCDETPPASEYAGPGSSAIICPIHVVENYYVSDGPESGKPFTVTGKKDVCVIGVDVRQGGIRRPSGIHGIPAFPS